ncbi:MAG: TlpA disulfide reductase family protein, partial [Bacteroidales bacterium]
KLDYDQKCIPIRFCWAKRGTGVKMDADPDFVAYVNSFDLNDITYIQVTEQILRWKMGCNPTDENSRIREMKLAKEIISNENVINMIAGDIMSGTLSTGGGDDLVAVFDQYKKTTTNQKELESFMPIYSSLAKLTKGVMATNFQMQDDKGNKVNFLDVIGKDKVVYIDFWATWCGPCCQEIPFVEKLVEKYKNNPNIEFISISLDDKPAKWHAKLAEDKPQWRQFIIPDNFMSDFAKEYNIRAIPRFMMFDKQGKIISVNAARPSDPKIDGILMESIQ